MYHDFTMILPWIDYRALSNPQSTALNQTYQSPVKEATTLPRIYYDFVTVLQWLTIDLYFIPKHGPYTDLSMARKKDDEITMILPWLYHDFTMICP